MCSVPSGTETDIMKMTLFVSVLALLAVPVFAENETSNETDLANVTVMEENQSFVEENVGALPGELGYGFQRFFENVDLFFTLDKAEKAKKHAKFGKLRALEAHVMTKKYQELMAEGKEAEANETLAVVEDLTEEQNSEMEAAQEDLEAAVEEGTADEDDVEEVEGQLRNSIMVLQRVYEKVPESAKDGVLRALNNSIMNQERHEQKVAEKAQEKEEKKEQKMNKGNESQVQNEAGENETDDNESEVSSGNGKGNTTQAQNKTKTEKEEKVKDKSGKSNGDSEDEDESGDESEDDEDEDESEDEDEEESED